MNEEESVMSETDVDVVFDYIANITPDGLDGDLVDFFNELQETLKKIEEVWCDESEPPAHNVVPDDADIKQREKEAFKKSMDIF